MTSTRDVRAVDQSGQVALEVLVYSDDAETRSDVVLAVGRRAADDLPPLSWTEVATHAAVVELAESGRFAALVLDGEAAKAGGLGVCRQLKAEVYECPPVIVLTARSQDSWLAAWSGADAVLCAPLDPIEMRDAVAAVIREQLR